VLAGVAKRTFHDIRRTAITKWFQQGLSPTFSLKGVKGGL